MEDIDMEDIDLAFSVRLALAWIVLAAAIFSPAVATASSRYPGTRLTTVDSVPVFFSAGSKQTRQAACPRSPLRLSSTRISQAAKAVARAMPAFYNHAKRQSYPRVDARDAVARAYHSATAHMGLDFRSECNALVWQRSALVVVHLPHVTFSASLAWLAFDVARIRQGWIIWAEVH